MPQTLKIIQVLNGWVVHAGCQTLVFNNAETLADEFRQWLLKPDEVEKHYVEHYGAKKGGHAIPWPDRGPEPDRPQIGEAQMAIGLKGPEQADRAS